LLDGPPSRRADDITDEEDPQRTDSSAAGRTDSETLLPASCVYRASACRSTEVRSTIMPTFVTAFLTFEPTVRAGSARRCIIETITEGASSGRMSTRAPKVRFERT